MQYLWVISTSLSKTAVFSDNDYIIDINIDNLTVLYVANNHFGAS